MTPHRLDPVALHRSAAFLGALEARGLIAPTESVAALAHRIRRTTGIDRSGLRMRLMHTLSDANAGMTATLENLFWRVRDAARPAIDARAPRAAIRAAARAADPDDLLGRHRRDTIILALISKALRA